MQIVFSFIELTQTFQYVNVIAELKKIFNGSVLISIFSLSVLLGTIVYFISLDLNGVALHDFLLNNTKLILEPISSIVLRIMCARV